MGWDLDNRVRCPIIKRSQNRPDFRMTKLIKSSFILGKTHIIEWETMSVNHQCLISLARADTGMKRWRLKRMLHLAELSPPPSLYDSPHEVAVPCKLLRWETFCLRAESDQEDQPAPSPQPQPDRQRLAVFSEHCVVEMHA